MSEGQRVFLVKPGDVLLLGNVQIPADSDVYDDWSRFCDEVGIRVAVFEADITAAVAACTTCGQPMSSEPCTPTPSGEGHTWAGGVEQAEVPSA
jgi:hypothetical protein